MTRIPLVPVYPSFLFIFQEEKIIAEIKKWNSKYCILISDSCFQCLYADRKFWSRRYLFPHLCIRISDNTGYPDREFFFLIQEERDSFKELIAKKDQLNRMQRSVAKTFQEVLELTGSLCFMFRSTPTIRSSRVTMHKRSILKSGDRSYSPCARRWWRLLQRSRLRCSNLDVADLVGWEDVDKLYNILRTSFHERLLQTSSLDIFSYLVDSLGLDCPLPKLIFQRRVDEGKNKQPLND